ncbi:hypothetical protein SKAU_G00265560 [Synaphobranchus kaupii]|uniref:Uncharacterized protein n=1 Tax=Synaphobranchus kaupii TaxID=118154 RepID=A0A9Q1EZ89_SYNKA|nr:hypothetical protein SKAU_G00265560 [Synaphobranchus kaupii]
MIYPSYRPRSAQDVANLRQCVPIAKARCERARGDLCVDLVDVSSLRRSCGPFTRDVISQANRFKAVALCAPHKSAPVISANLPALTYGRYGKYAAANGDIADVDGEKGSDRNAQVPKPAAKRTSPRRTANGGTCANMLEPLFSHSRRLSLCRYSSLSLGRAGTSTGLTFSVWLSTRMQKRGS